MKPRVQRPPFIESLKDSLNDRIIILVGIFAILSIIPGMVVEPSVGWVEGVFILVALCVQVLITSWNDYSKDNKFVELQSMNREENMPVLRGKKGSMQTVSVWNLVVGDIITMQPGDKVPADCIVIESANLHVNEPTRHVELDGPTQVTFAKQYKNATERPFLYVDSYILNGTCKAVVCCVGENSTRGADDTKYDTGERETELTAKLSNIETTLQYFALIGAIVILATSMLVIFLQVGINDMVGGAEFTKKLVDNIVIALVMLIVSVPEGLPMTIQISLAHSVLQMSEHDNVLVRDLDSVEEAGLLSDICMGKTGTMTTEEMEVDSFFTQKLSVQNSRKNTLMNCQLDQHIIDKIKESVIYNSTAHIEMDENSFYVPKGNGTEVSLIRWLQGAEIAVHEVVASKEGRVLAEVPFNSKLKRSITAIQLPDMQDTVRIFIKGAPEIVVRNCKNHFKSEDSVTPDGVAFKAAEKVPIQEQDKSQILDVEMKRMLEEPRRSDAFSGTGENLHSMRAIAFSYCDMNLSSFQALMQSMQGEIDSSDEINALEQDQTFLALVVLRDPVRKSIREIVRESEESGVNLHLISGDNLGTACKLARDIGMLTQEDMENNPQSVMDAATFRELTGDVIKTEEPVEDGQEQTYTYSLASHNQERFNDIVDSLKVIGRAEPEDKLRLVVALQNAPDQTSDRRRKVAIVGEGINDIDAFDAADVSFAVQSGTSVARNKASMVLRTDDFESCLQAVKWGRNIYMNVRRFLQFQITCNFTLVVIMIVSYCTMTEGILNATQLIYINLIMDIFGALALASTRPIAGTERYDTTGKILTPAMYRQIFGMTLFMIAIMMVIMFAGQNIFDLPYLASTQTIDKDILGLGKNKMTHFTLCWNCFVFLQIFNLINCRDVSSNGMNGF